MVVGAVDTFDSLYAVDEVRWWRWCVRVKGIDNKQGEEDNVDDDGESAAVTLGDGEVDGESSFSCFAIKDNEHVVAGKVVSKTKVWFAVWSHRNFPEGEGEGVGILEDRLEEEKEEEEDGDGGGAEKANEDDEDEDEDEDEDDDIDLETCDARSNNTSGVSKKEESYANGSGSDSTNDDAFEGDDGGGGGGGVGVEIWKRDWCDDSRDGMDEDVMSMLW